MAPEILRALIAATLASAAGTRVDRAVGMRRVVVMAATIHQTAPVHIRRPP
jgi:hypothetical protein